MTILLTILMALQVLSALAVIVLVLLQHGKGADMGAAFGSGASGSLFGASGSANFLSRSTGVLAAVFFCATLGITMLSDRRAAPERSVMEGAVVPAQKTPGTPAPAAAPAEPGSVGQGSAGQGSAGQGSAAVGPASIPAPAQR